MTDSSTYALYVIPGSHACRSAMLMLDHKRVSYRRVQMLTGLHPVEGRLRGFDAGGQTRAAGGLRTFAIRFGDGLATVPGLASGDRRISTNSGIARFLENTHPDRPLFPVDPDQRRAVEQVEHWANDKLQMDARRIVACAMVRDPRGFSHASADGRMGYLLYRSALARRLILPRFVPSAFAVRRETEPELLAELPRTLDRIDSWIADGVLGGPQLNVADFMVAPSLALILYRSDVRPMFDGRPALRLVDRLLPEPPTTAAKPTRSHR
jgi:glutathione S-transferase